MVESDGLEKKKGNVWDSLHRKELKGKLMYKST